MAEIPRGLRNNNPGNIEDGKFAKSMPGYVGSDGRFAVFDSLDAGAHAMQRLLGSYGRKGLDTVEKVINRWAPASENDSKAYAKTVAASLGLKPGDKIDLSDPDTLAGLSSAMAGVENGQSVTLGYVDGASLGNGALGAVNDMAGSVGGIEPRVVQAQYVPPPLSGQQGQFAPLFNTEPQQQQPAPVQPGPVQPAPAPAMAPETDILKQWGIKDAAPAQGTPQVAPDADILLQWGIVPDEAPAKSMESSQSAAPSAKGSAKTDPSKREGGSSFSQMGMDALGAVNAGLRGVVEGIPVAGGPLRKGLDYVSGTAGALADLAQGNEASLPRSVAAAQDVARQNEQQNPLARGMGNVVGAVGGTAAMVAANPAAMGVSPSLSLPQNMLMSGSSGGAINALDAYMRGAAPDDIRRSGETGFVVGGLAPAVARGVGAAVDYGRRAVRNLTPSGKAANALLEMTRYGDQTPDDIARELARNPRLSPMDVDPNLQQGAMNLANQGGEARSILSNAVNTRASTAKGAVEDAFDQKITKVPNVKTYLEGLIKTARTNGAKNFEPVLDRANGVNVSGVIDAIDKKVYPGISKMADPGSQIPKGPVENELLRVKALLTNGKETLTDARRLHEIQSALRVDAEDMLSSASGQDRRVGKALMDVRSKIVDALDSATGGKFKPAQAQYASDMAINGAFEKGVSFATGAKSGVKSLQNRPEYFEDWWKSASQPEKDAFKVGLRVSVDQSINGFKSAAVRGETIPEIGFNKQILDTALGKSEADQLQAMLRDERAIANTNAKLFAGSQTAPRQAINKLTQVREVPAGIALDAPTLGAIGGYMGGIPGAAAGVGLSAAKKGVQYGLRARDLASNKLLAQALSGGLSEFEAGIAPVRNSALAQQITQQRINRLIGSVAPAAVTEKNVLSSQSR